MRSASRRVPAAGHRARPAPRDGRRGRRGGARDHVVDLDAALPRLHRPRLRDGGGVRRRDRAAGGVAAGRRRQPGRVPAPDGQPGRPGSVRCRPAARRCCPCWPGPQGRRAELPHRVRGRRRLRHAARPRRARARRAGRDLRALERPRPPHRLKGAAIPRPMRIAQLSQELEVLARIEGIAAGPSTSSRPGAARPTTRSSPISSSRTAPAGGRRSNRPTPGTRRSPWRPPCAPLDDAAVHESLLVLADFADLKSPWTSGHSRAVAALAREACGPAAEAAALVHDLGCVAVPNTIWDKPGPLTRDERDRAETHALVTDQLLRRVPYTADPGRDGRRRARALRRLRLPPARQRRPPRRGPAGHRRGRLLPGHDLRSPAPPRARPGGRRGRAAGHERATGASMARRSNGCWPRPATAAPPARRCRPD